MVIKVKPQAKKAKVEIEETPTPTPTPTRHGSDGKEPEVEKIVTTSVASSGLVQYSDDSEDDD